MSSYDSRPDTYEHIGVVRGFMLRAAGELLRRAHVHDLSKLSSPEREMFDEFTPKLRGTTYGSEEYKRYTSAMGEALQHHYALNSHHPEHFVDGIRSMSLLHLTEMLCDWMAAVQRHDDGDIRRSIDLNQERWGYSDELKQILHNTVDDLERAAA